MKTKEINTIADMQRFVEGCLNDYEAGIATKDETLKHLEDYTFRLLELNEMREDILLSPEKELKPLEALYRKEHPQKEYYVPDKTKFYRWIRKKIRP